MNGIWFPAQRVIRTVLQVVAGLVLTSAATLGAFQLWAPDTLEALRELLPPDWYASAAAFIAVTATISGALAKIMANPAVDHFLKKFGAGSAPDGAVAYTDTDGNMTPMTRRQWRAFIRNGGGALDREPGDERSGE